MAVLVYPLLSLTKVNVTVNVTSLGRLFLSPTQRFITSLFDVWLNSLIHDITVWCVTGQVEPWRHCLMCDWTVWTMTSLFDEWLDSLIRDVTVWCAIGQFDPWRHCLMSDWTVWSMTSLFDEWLDSLNHDVLCRIYHVILRLTSVGQDWYIVPGLTHITFQSIKIV